MAIYKSSRKRICFLRHHPMHACHIEEGGWLFLHAQARTSMCQLRQFSRFVGGRHLHTASCVTLSGHTCQTYMQAVGRWVSSCTSMHPQAGKAPLPGIPVTFKAFTDTLNAII